MWKIIEREEMFLTTMQPLSRSLFSVAYSCMLSRTTPPFAYQPPRIIKKKEEKFL